MSSAEREILDLAKFGRFDQVLNLLQGEPSLMAARSAKGYTLLHQAGYWGKDVETVNKLVTVGGEASLLALQTKQKDGLTPIEYAVHKRHNWTAEALKRNMSTASCGVRGLGPQKCVSDRVICIGDVHGQVSSLKTLWKNLKRQLGEAALMEATVIFLGDYCDRGPRTREAIDFMIALRDSRSNGKTQFLAGNHDFAMAAFLGCLPTCDDNANLDWDWTKDPAFEDGFWQHPLRGGMHYQGRRWGGSDIYEADTTFESYGVRWDPKRLANRDELIHAVPEAHKQFLRSLVWVHEEPVSFAPGLVTCVHAGLVTSQPAEPQLEALRARDPAATTLHDAGKAGRIAAFSARTTVKGMHPDLRGKSLLVSGHHGRFCEDNDRIINDRNGGNGVVEAFLFPERTVISGC